VQPEKERKSAYCCEGGLQEVAHGCSATLGLRVDVLDTSELEETVGCRSSDDASTARGRDEAAHDGADLARDLAGYGVRLTESDTPVTTTDGNNRELGEDDSATDGGGHFLCALDTETDMSVEVTDSNERLEASTLTSTSLLLDGHDLHNLVLELGQEEVDDLELLHWQREQVDLLHGLDLAILYQTAELGDRHPVGQVLEPSCSSCKRWRADIPILLIVLARTTTRATTPTTAVATSATITTTSTSESTASALGHNFGCCFGEER